MSSCLPEKKGQNKTVKSLMVGQWHWQCPQWRAVTFAAAIVAAELGLSLLAVISFSLTGTATLKKPWGDADLCNLASLARETYDETVKQL